jgi:mitogen-activated protein kinase 15
MKVLRMYRSLNNKDIYIVAEFIENDLHAVIRANICEDLQRKYIIWQLLKALKVNSLSLKLFIVHALSKCNT